MSQNIEQQLAEQGFYVSTTVGCSMRPMLRNRRDRVIILPVGSERLKRFDLPLYRRPDGKYILHRIIDVKDGYYVIRGDNTYVKEHIPDEWILGYVSEFYRSGKHHSTDEKSYRRYARFWNAIFPIRRFLRLFLQLYWKMRSVAARTLRALGWKKNRQN